MKKNSEYKKKKAIKRYLDGEKVKQIAGTMKISTSTIYSWIRQNNEKRNSIANEVWATPWAEATSVGKSSVHSGQSERYIQYLVKKVVIRLKQFSYRRIFFFL